MKLSVVIPCRNEALYIEECIEAIYVASLPDEVVLSVYVVDGMSDDGTREIIHQLKDSYPSLELIDNVKQLTPYAFNLGIYAKPCDYVQIIGARHIISSNYLLNNLKTLQNDSSIWCVGGKIENEYVNETGKVIALAMGTQLGMGIGNFRTLDQSGFTDTVTSPMYPYWVFEKIGFFDEELIRNQDDDFNYRVTKAGGKIFFDATISLKYYVRGNFEQLKRQFFQYGYWKVYVNKKHQAVTTIRQLVPPLFVAYLFLFVISFLFGIYIIGVGSLPFVIYLALVFYVSTELQKNNKELKLWDIFKTFPILHVSYGLGYLNGIWDFLVMKKQPSDKNKVMSR
ncbi:MAG: glycosyltransferase family 2 protein [Crocinitomicaceae bacterium]|nr:glycosyltransferase family 2 protein [Crocinitomicaceae bacterium]